MPNITPHGTSVEHPSHPGRTFFFVEPGIHPKSDPRFAEFDGAKNYCDECGASNSHGLWFSKPEGIAAPITLCASCGPDVYPHSVTYSVPGAGRVTAKYRVLPLPERGTGLPEFTLVARGPTWKWGEQDGTPGAIGWLSETSTGGSKWRSTQWHCGGTNNYRMLAPDLCDILPIVLSPACVVADMVPGAAGPVPPPRRARASVGEAAAGAAASGAHAGYPICVKYNTPGSGVVEARYRKLPQPGSSEPLPRGTVVVRGPSWSWNAQDGSPGAPGWLVESKKASPGWVTVCWHQNGAKNGYRMNASEQDLTPVELEPGPAAEAIRKASGGIALVGDPPAAAAATPSAAAAAARGHADGMAADEALAIMRAEKVSLEDEIKRLHRARKEVEVERDSAVGACDALRARVARLEADGASAGAAAAAASAKAANSGLGDCHVCYDEVVNTALMPCGHICFCSEHAKDAVRCPVCMQAVTGTLRVFPAGHHD